MCRDERIAGLLIWIKAAKDTIFAAEAFSIVLSFFNFVSVTFFIVYRMIRRIILAKSK